MENPNGTGRGRRQITKRVAWSPEPTSNSQIKKADPKPKYSFNNSKQKTSTTAAEKKVTLPRKSLPSKLDDSNEATFINDDINNKSLNEPSYSTINQHSSSEVKGRRLKLKSLTSISAAPSNGAKTAADNDIQTPSVPSKQVISEIQKQAQIPKKTERKIVKTNVQPSQPPPRRGLLALNKYIPSSKKDFQIPEKILNEKEDLLHSSEVKPGTSDSGINGDAYVNEKTQVDINISLKQNVKTEVLSPENTSLIENHQEALELEIKEEQNNLASENTPLLISSSQIVEKNDTSVKEIKSEITEKMIIKDKVSPLKISLARHRPSLPMIPAKSPPLTVERPSFSGRARKPPPSKEYPGHDESFSTSSGRKRSKVTKPIIQPLSIPSVPITPGPTSVKEFIHLLEQRGEFRINYSGPPSGYCRRTPTPPLQQTLVKSELPSQLAESLTERSHRNKSKNVSEFASSIVSQDLKSSVTLSSENQKLYSPPFSYEPLTSPPTQSIVEDEHISIEEDIFAENFEIEDSTIFQDQVKYLQSLHFHLQKSFEPLEINYEDEYFLREILTHDILHSESSISNEDDISVDEIDTRTRKYNFNLKFSTLKYAQHFIKMFPDNSRVILESVPESINEFYADNNATGLWLKIFYEILQKQCCMELAVKNHQNPLASYYLYSLQNATLLRSNIFLHFSYEFVQAHEWLIRNLEEDALASYLILLKFLQAAGTTLANILISQSTPNDPTNIEINNNIREMLEEKVRDPFSQMVTQLDRKLKCDNSFLMLISPGIKLQNEMSNAVYHAHEQLFIGLTNMGCPIEKIIIKEDNTLSEDFTISDACNFAVNFIKNKIIDAVKRRPNERIFIASWGVTCLFVHEAVIHVDGVTGIIDLAMPVKSAVGSRGKIGDKMLLTYCPTLVVIGEDSDEVSETAEMLNNFHISTGLCVVGKADSSLIVEPNLLARYGITQACISRIILNHVMDFIENVVRDTHNEIHTKKFEATYPWIIEEDLNDHVMRDDLAYGVDETFYDDEEDPLNKPIIPIVQFPSPQRIPKCEVRSPSHSLKDETELVTSEPTIKNEYSEGGDYEIHQNIKSEFSQMAEPAFKQHAPPNVAYNYQQDYNESSDILQEFLDEDYVPEVRSEGTVEEDTYDEEMEYEEQMAAEAIEGGFSGEQNGYE